VLDGPAYFSLSHKALAVAGSGVLECDMGVRGRGFG